jgi:hypothetical protein
VRKPFEKDMGVNSDAEYHNTGTITQRSSVVSTRTLHTVKLVVSVSILLLRIRKYFFPQCWSHYAIVNVFTVLHVEPTLAGVIAHLPPVFFVLANGTINSKGGFLQRFTGPAPVELGVAHLFVRIFVNRRIPYGE